MPLLDHFRPPLSERRHWHSFHNAWATYLSSQLNSQLPEGYFAEPNVQFGIEIDVATFEASPVSEKAGSFAPLPPHASVPLELSGPVVEVGIFSRSGGPTLAGVIELVSPANKDRPTHREALVTKYASYIQAGIGLVLVDVVTDRQADLHCELLQRLGAVDTIQHFGLFASAYRPVDRKGLPALDLWHHKLAVGSVLPTLPLCLRGDLCLPVELEATYERTCEEQRVRIAA